MSSKQIVEMGKRVKLSLNDKICELEIVNSLESSPADGKISLESPVARAIIDHRCPDRLEIKLPNGNIINCQLIEITKTEQLQN